MRSVLRSGLGAAVGTTLRCGTLLGPVLLAGPCGMGTRVIGRAGAVGIWLGFMVIVHASTLPGSGRHAYRVFP